MKRLTALALAALFFCASIPHAHAAAGEWGVLVPPTVFPETADVPVTGQGDALDLSCASAVLMEKETGTILYEKDAYTRREPASVTKIMTMLLVMEAVDSGKISLDDIVTASAHATGMGGSQVYLKEGEQMTVREMLKCVAVVSGNDCAVALAEHLAGSETAFVERMNARAAELGMKDTHFLNCTGLPAAGHETSAYDIALMSRELIRSHPDIRQFTTIWMDSIRDGAFGLTNTNRLVRFYNGATGLKTGSTDGAQYCISATAERDGMELIAVVLKSPTGPQRFEDAKAMLDYGFAGWTLVEAWPDAPLAPVDVSLGVKSQVQPVLEQKSQLLVKKGEESQVSTRLNLSESLEAPVEKGQKIGELEVYVGEELRQKTAVLASESVERLTVPGIFLHLLRSLLMAQ